jgi:hypothetical protein
MAFYPFVNVPYAHDVIAQNSLLDFSERAGGRFLCVSANITGTGTVTQNVFNVTGSVEILKTWALITSVTTLTNMTDIYADVYDGTVSIKLTNGNPGGAVLSGAPVGTFFTKDKDSSNAYTVLKADQVRVLESTNDRNIQLPFVVTQKNGVSTYIRFNYTTTDSPVDFDMDIFFEWRPLDGGNLEVV